MWEDLISKDEFLWDFLPQVGWPFSKRSQRVQDSKRRQQSVWSYFALRWRRSGRSQNCSLNLKPIFSKDLLKFSLNIPCCEILFMTMLNHWPKYILCNSIAGRWWLSETLSMELLPCAAVSRLWWSLVCSRNDTWLSSTQPFLTVTHMKNWSIILETVTLIRWKILDWW